MNKAALIICLAPLLYACSNKENSLPSPIEMSAVRARLAFTCTHEVDHLPSLDPIADQIFKYGRHLEKKNGPKDSNDIARYYRIAAAYGHYKANNNLQGLLTDGSASSPDAAGEAIDLAGQLIKEGVPGGYYDMGHYLEDGYGVDQDADMARRHFRKAADLGSPEAQYYVGYLLLPSDKAPDIARQMIQCAIDQGYGKAASTLGMDRQDHNLFPEAVEAFQKGVEAGDSQSASLLEDGFKAPPPTQIVNYMALPADPERSRRYRLIWEFLTDNDGRNPKVPDIDQIVPLPPTKLPPWDGTFQWQKEQDAAVPPQKPSDQLIERLAKAKNLDPATGLPLSASKTSQIERPPLGTAAKTGERCPQDGVWRVSYLPRTAPNAVLRLCKGDIMPPLVMNSPRMVPGLDSLLGMRQHRSEVEWKLISYDDQA
ncbi:hypothetical protein R69927_02528 [Paraburkholderia domus]|uniref:SEL1-like repeat protein n=1 Tax=Paraburkholderia domus TaxID=2793075 RepID=UPI0019139E10|nr:sel1 repeat family protein [Paraburkholderia domus]MBK5087392.1 sel1 repeat family protein [Burkholderia sp. R-69927]MBK5180674.1 sel1 repeat family protein [Burkholderia sp. R-69749]CAE6729164.1 hypothetical protein R75483_02107 [Paraburkholderia domus]CAE6803067.1 hypothetical protein R69749_02700 [Paraburkholderia domus]CAE6859340.1 hypothetical protein R69927_02528 [Paraburkholderia domus]